MGKEQRRILMVGPDYLLGIYLAAFFLTHARNNVLLEVDHRDATLAEALRDALAATLAQSSAAPFEDPITRFQLLSSGAEQKWDLPEIESVWLLCGGTTNSAISKA